MHPLQTPASLANKGRFHRVIAIHFVFVVFLQGCSGPWLRVRQVPEDGYKRTLHYQFQVQVHADADGNCKMMAVRVKALNKVYTKGAPPPRLRLFDDDCMSPLRFERVHYISETGGPVHLSGPDVVRFLGEHFRLEGEIIEWLWREGVI